MQRSFGLLKQIGGRNTQPQDVIPPRDVLYHFCSDAFHLRDWIAATVGTDESTTKALARQIDNEVVLLSPELSACCDVANGFKHLVLHRRSYVTGANQGHAEVVSHDVGIGVPPLRIEVRAFATAIVIHPDGTIDADPPPEPEPEPEPPTVPASASDAGWVQDTFKIEINGQQHDARDVATKAVAAWDQWLAGTSPIATQLRST